VLHGVFADGAHGLLWGAAYTSLLAAACAFDIRSRRIPNWLVAILGALGIAFSIARLGAVAGSKAAAVGFAVGLLLWILPFVLRMLGAGDVKLFAAAGAWIGALGAVYAAFYAALLGGALGLAWWLRLRRGAKIAPVRPTLPYGVPMAIGLALVAWRGLP
jgi:prepilin peptidase CpaA